MAENDIYNSKGRYQRLKRSIKEFYSKGKKSKNGKYYPLNKSNIKYFDKLISNFEFTDISYINRNKKLQYFKQILSYTKKNLKDINDNDDRDEINKIIARARKVFSEKSIRYFISEFKTIWKILFPERDEKGREDESRMPYVVKHLSTKIDRSKQKERLDRISVKEYNDIIDALSFDSRVQFFCSLIYDSFGRPQEILYLKIKNVEIFDNYAKIRITEHGKEGTGLLRCINSFPYLIKHLKEHPNKNNPEAWLFCNKVGKTKYGQMTVFNANKIIKLACKKIGLNKPITGYSFKRNGISNARLDPNINDKDIQDRARWITSVQLQTYDITAQEESFRAELIRKGLINGDNFPKKEKISEINELKIQMLEMQDKFNAIISRIEELGK